MNKKQDLFLRARMLKANLIEQPKLINAVIRMSGGRDYHFHDKTKGYNRVGPEISVTAHLNEPFVTKLQFWGWELILKDDGTWFWNDTSGG
jgi:hypothetical protein